MFFFHQQNNVHVIAIFLKFAVYKLTRFNFDLIFSKIFNQPFETLKKGYKIFKKASSTC